MSKKKWDKHPLRTWKFTMYKEDAKGNQKFYEYEGDHSSFTEGIDDEDKAKKGKSYETNKESNKISSTNITQDSVHGGSPLQLSSTNMPVGLDSLKRDSDDKITQPDPEGSTEEMLDIPEENEEIKAEKSAVEKMMDWLHEV